MTFGEVAGVVAFWYWLFALDVLTICICWPLPIGDAICTVCICPLLLTICAIWGVWVICANWGICINWPWLACMMFGKDEAKDCIGRCTVWYKVWPLDDIGTWTGMVCWTDGNWTTCGMFDCRTEMFCPKNEKWMLNIGLRNMKYTSDKEYVYEILKIIIYLIGAVLFAMAEQSVQ